MVREGLGSASVALLALSSLTWASVCGAQEGKPLLLRAPAISRSQVVFSYAGDLWSVSREGGEARRLTSGVGIETDPCFSPDGTQIAFRGEYDGNTDVYVMPATGGIPKRLTYHPAPDMPVGWTPDGKRIVFVSGRDAATPVPHLLTISKEGGQAQSLPLPTGVAASYDAAGTHLAYVPTAQWQRAWKRYHGGQTTPIWIADLATSHIEKVPRVNSNDSNPMWIGDQVYFLSDRSGSVGLFAYNTATKKVRPVLKNEGLDIKSASAGAGAIVYEQFGALHIYDLATGKDRPLAVTISADLPEVRPHYENVAARVAGMSISPSGARAVVEARGEILTVPAEKGTIRNLTNTPGVMERSPAWSPDGRWIAYFSDESGEYALHLRDANGKGDTRKISLGSPPSFFYDPVWSPDSKKIAYTDKRLNFWYVDIDKGVPVKIDTDTYLTPSHPDTPRWSPDSKYVTYVRELKNHLGAVFVYALDEAKPHQITDGMSDARYADFDKSGKYLYCTASTNSGPSSGWLDMSSVNRPITRAVYVVVLRKDLPSPLAPESDEEKAVEAAKPDVSAAVSPAAAPPAGTPAVLKPAVIPAAKDAFRIDLDGIGQRILALPIPARNFTALAAGKAGALFLLEGSLVPGEDGGGTLHRFDLGARKLTPLGSATAFDITPGGDKMLVMQGPQLAIVSTAAPIAPGAGALNLSGMEVMVDPVAEWKQMYREVWRIERDFFYDPNLHGLNLPAVQQKYAAYLDRLASRADPQLSVRGDAGRTDGWTHVHTGRRDAPRQTRVGRAAGRGLQDRERALPLCPHLQRRKLEPRHDGPAHAAGGQCPVGRVPAGGERARRQPRAGSVCLFRGYGGQAGSRSKWGPSADGANAREVIVVPGGQR